MPAVRRRRVWQPDATAVLCVVRGGQRWDGSITAVVTFVWRSFTSGARDKHPVGRCSGRGGGGGSRDFQTCSWLVTGGSPQQTLGCRLILVKLTLCAYFHSGGRLPRRASDALPAQPPPISSVLYRVMHPFAPPWQPGQSVMKRRHGRLTIDGLLPRCPHLSPAASPPPPGNSRSAARKRW